MARIRESEVQAQVRRINLALGRPTGYARGAIILQGAYGGWQVQEIMSDQGSVRSLTSGFRPLREASDYLAGMEAGIEARKA